MNYSTRDTQDFRSMVNILTTTRLKDSKNVILCELSYLDKSNGKIYNKVYPASKFDKVCKVYYAINSFYIPKDEVKDAVENIK